MFPIVQVSPDGKWIAFTSTLTGRREIYVQPFPSGSGRWQISPDANNGGDWPRWRRDSQELFYHALGPASGNAAVPEGLAFTGPVLSATIGAAGGTLQHDTPQEIVRFFALGLAHSGGEYDTYDVSADGQRLLTLQRVITTGAAGTQISPDVTQGIIVAMHWAAALKK